MPETPPLKSAAASTGLWLRLAGLLAVVTLLCGWELRNQRAYGF